MNLWIQRRKNHLKNGKTVVCLRRQFKREKKLLNKIEKLIAFIKECNVILKINFYLLSMKVPFVKIIEVQTVRWMAYTHNEFTVIFQDEFFFLYFLVIQ